MMSHVKRATRLSALALAAALALSACGGTGTREGVVVDGTSYSVQEVQEATRTFQELTGQQVTQQAVATVAASVPVLDRYFQGTALAPSEGSLRTQLRTSGLNEEPSPLIMDIARYQYYFGVLNDPALQGEEAYGEIAAQMQTSYESDLAAQDVEVNPRLGTWDPAAGQVLPEAPAWISQPGTS